jgi:hypothetical protein
MYLLTLILFFTTIYSFLVNIKYSIKGVQTILTEPTYKEIDLDDLIESLDSEVS